MNPVKLTQELLKFPSVSPDSGGCMDFVERVLKNMGAQTVRLDTNQEGRKTANLYAKIGNSPRIFGFAGHTDVVPEGNDWSFPPYAGVIQDGVLYGRGVVDMKAAIAAFICATNDFLPFLKDFSIAFLITGDEEDRDDQGTVRIVDFLKSQSQRLACCLIGEPSSQQKFGDMIKVGRRGSLSFDLDVRGTQGHVAYPQNAYSPIPLMLDLLQDLQNFKFDNGYDFFDPTHLEITSIDTGNTSRNTIPSKITAKGNVRFNPNHTRKSLQDTLTACIKNRADISFHGAGEAFLSTNLSLATLAQTACQKVIGTPPTLSTSGGTSDARFITNICDNIAELGLSSQTAHKTDEHAQVQDIHNLKEVYREILTTVTNNP